MFASAMKPKASNLSAISCLGFIFLLPMLVGETRVMGIGRRPSISAKETTQGVPSPSTCWPEPTVA